MPATRPSSKSLEACWNQLFRVIFVCFCILEWNGGGDSAEREGCPVGVSRQKPAAGASRSLNLLEWRRGGERRSVSWSDGGDARGSRQGAAVGGPAVLEGADLDKLEGKR